MEKWKTSHTTLSFKWSANSCDHYIRTSVNVKSEL